MTKIIIRMLLGVIILAAAAVLIAGLFLDRIVKKGIETFGPQIAKVDIKVEAVHIGLISGSCTVKGLVVGNPAGYKAVRSVSIGRAGISVSPGSLFSNKIVIRSIRIDAPEVTFEGGIKNNNLTRILDNVNASVGGKNKGEETAGSAKAKGKKIQVDDLLITGARVHIGSGRLTAPLPEIHLTAMGAGPEGITPGELTKQVLEELVSGVLKAAAGSIADLGKGAVDAAGKAVKGISNIFKRK